MNTGCTICQDPERETHLGIRGNKAWWKWPPSCSMHCDSNICRVRNHLNTLFAELIYINIYDHSWTWNLVTIPYWAITSTKHNASCFCITPLRLGVSIKAPSLGGDSNGSYFYKTILKHQSFPLHRTCFRKYVSCIRIKKMSHADRFHKFEWHLPIF